MTEVKSVLITGCSTGIGLDAAKQLHDKGFDVYATARKPQDVEQLRALGLNAKVLDLDDEISISNALKWVLEQSGGELHALFNNGAYGQPGAIEDLPTEALRAQFETNLFGWHSLTKAVLPIMRKQGFGRIIQCSSVLGLVAMPYRGAYNASKFALEGYTDTLRLELRGTDIHVSLIEPGPIDTQFRSNALEKIHQYIDIEHSVHRSNYEPQVKRLASRQTSTQFTLPASAVTKKLEHALTAKRPKIRYYVTFPTYLMAVLKRLIPFSWLDSILVKN